MKTRETIYRQIEGLWENAVALSTSALVLWTLFQICCLTLGDIAVHLALLNGAWQRDIAEHCVQHVSKCQRVSFNQQYLTTQHGGPTWQWVGARLDVSIVCPGGTDESIRQALVDYMGDWTAGRISLRFVDSRGQQWS
jgi:hypothetical protein